ncbi:uncharacterized protein LOC119249669 isoform X2 [Talpa occidentalis]|uniref:uncharacterized protein LOC119249669 isoform X2 n=1 Tax=Talpa occidentalis TaxID=50954 RepID=UPI00188F177B|nr:uncharacterized protein LOC119249669 isoform X2 [Talpa occidentalis]
MTGASSWEKDRKFVLRGWALVFSTLATLMSLSVMDGRMAYLEAPYMGHVSIWSNCGKYQCAHLGRVTVLLHMSTGFMVLVMALSLVLLSTMGLSFHGMFHRLNKVDAIFSFLSLSIGFLIILSLLFFVITCETLHPKPKVYYLMTSYLCWGGGALMLWAGALSYLNHAGLWSKGEVTMDRCDSYRRWFSKHSASNLKSKPLSSMESGDPTPSPVHAPPGTSP